MDNAELGLILKRLRTENKLLQSDIAAIVGKSSSAISRYEKGEAEIPATVLIDLCVHFNTSIDTLLGNTNPISGFDNTLNKLLIQASDIDVQKIKHYLEVSLNILKEDSSTYQYETSNSLYIAEETNYYAHLLPVRGYVAAGTPIEAIDSNLSSIGLPPDIDADYALIVNGNSMYPIIEDGEYVYIKHASELDNNDIGVFYYNGNVTCKKFFKNDVMIKLISINPAYEDFVFYINDSKNENINFKIEGKVVLSTLQRKRLEHYYQKMH